MKAYYLDLSQNLSRARKNMYAKKNREGVGGKEASQGYKNILLNDFHRKKMANGKS